MLDIINLLPDSVANQIAAGEVIQRPSSAVKELMENAIDAGANELKVIVKDAGKTLIQVIDNGCGMSPVDARMSFERHATSKIKTADDLFDIRTMGFRGEALASIAAIAQVELKTKRFEDPMGTQIMIEGTQVKSQNEVVCSNGSVFSIRNLFFNVPARRNFLKSNPIEMRHIVDVFIRVALINPQIAFNLYEEQQLKYNLPKSGLKQRIVDIFGKHLNQNLLSIDESTEPVNISGFIGKPETARKTRGEQYFFVNKRFIKHPYLHHAVQSAFEELIPDGAFPTYFIHFDIDPHKVDVNIHPTKTEVNFEDERTIYQILRAAIKMTLGKFSFSPMLDFETEMSFNPAPLPSGTPVKAPEIRVNTNYNPFEGAQKSSATASSFQRENTDWERQRNNQQNWQKMYEEKGYCLPSALNKSQKPQLEWDENLHAFQLAHRYIAVHDTENLWIINQQAAHERVLFDRFSEIMQQQKPMSQQMLFPEDLHFGAADYDLILELWDEIHQMGFRLEKAENKIIRVNGAPTEFDNESLQPILEGMLEHYKNNQLQLQTDKTKSIILAMSKNLAVKPGRKLSKEELNALLEAWLHSEQKEVSPSGQTIYSCLSPDEIDKLF